MAADELISNQPLSGRTIVITRSRAQAADFVTELERYGARVIICPMIEVVEPESYQRLDEAIDHLYGYDWIIFTSVNGVDYFLRRLQAQQHEVSELDELKVSAIGEATANALVAAHVHVDLIPDQFNAEGVLNALERFVGGATAIVGLNMLIPRAAVGRDYLPAALSAAGARVDVVPAYRTIQPEGLDSGRVSALLAGGAADCIAFTSSSAVRNLAQTFDTNDLSAVLDDVTIGCIGDVTAGACLELGLAVDIQPQEFTIPALARAIAEHFNRI